MEIVIIDHDLLNQRQSIEDKLSRVKSKKLISIQDVISPMDHVPVRGVVLTKLSSGLLSYHLSLIDQHPQIQHWVFCVADKVGNAVQQSLRKHFSNEMSSRNAYCELLFDETQKLEKLVAWLEVPAKTANKCVVVSNNGALAENVGNVIREYLHDWEVVSGSNPDYMYSDAVVVAGTTVSEMAVPCPKGETLKKFFWFQVPYAKNFIWKQDQISELKRTLNSLGWNIADYDSKTSFSNLLHEQFQLQIRQDEIHPIALVSDRQFVMWDSCGLPIPQTDWSEEKIVDFLSRNTVFPKMLAQIQKGKE